MTSHFFVLYVCVFFKIKKKCDCLFEGVGKETWSLEMDKIQARGKHGQNMLD